MSTTPTSPHNAGGRPQIEDRPRQPLHVSVSAYTADYIGIQVCTLRKPPMPEIRQPHGGVVLDLMKSFCARKGFDARKEQAKASSPAKEKREPVSTPAPAKPLPRHRG